MSRIGAYALSMGLLAAPSMLTGQQGTDSRTSVVFLGTGTPRPDPKRSGPATAIVVNGSPYLVDFGAGVIGRAVAAFDQGEKGLAIERLDIAFLTHLHSDHTVGLPDLIFTPWTHGRTSPLRIFGPHGIAAMTEHVLAAWKPDIDVRTQGFEARDRAGLRIEAKEIVPGVVYRDSNVTVTAFPVLHGDVPEAFGYRFETRDRTIVISGDASPSPALVAACNRCDILIHEAFSPEYTPARVPNWIAYRARFHTTTAQVAEIAKASQPGLLVLYHRGVRKAQGEISDEQYLGEVRRAGYLGKVVIAHDLDVR